MANIPPDERTIYLAFKDVFKGPDVQPRSEKTIRKKVRKHKNSNEEIKALVKEHNVGNVAKSVKVLLEGDIFASTLKAKIQFPELFDVSPAQSAERAASEAEAAEHESEAIREVIEGQLDQSVSTTVDTEHASLKGTETEGTKTETEDQAQETKPEIYRASSTYPFTWLEFRLT